ncbi:MAG: PocR ligand-binding domain-containing protein [Pseudomonadota bacterium]
MCDYGLSDLLDLTILQKMADSHYRAAGLPIGIIDAIDGSILVGSGWQDICVKFHRADPVSLQRCRESDNYIKDRLVQDEACHYKCKNGLWDIGVPIVVDGRHLATMFLGQFFYEGETPDREFFIKLAHEFGFDVEDYLAALDRVPIFSREKVDYILEYDKALVSFIADLAEHALLKIKADEIIHESERKFHAVFDQAYQFLGLLSIDGSVLKANGTALRFIGVEEADVIGRPFWETPWWAHSPKLQEIVRVAVQKAGKGELIRFEASHPAPDGTLHYVDFSIKPIKDEAGKVIMLMPEGREITERKKAEQERLTHLRFFKCIDQVNRAIQGANELERMMGNVLNTMLSIFDCDRAWLFYPCDPDAPTFRVPMEITKPEYPGAKDLNVDIPMSPDMAQNLREVLASDDPVIYIAGSEKPINKVTAEQFGVQSQMLVVLYPKSGKPWVCGMHQCSYPRIWTNEEKRLFQEIGRRLSDALTSLLILRNLKESEEKYRILIQKIQAAIVVHDSDTQILTCNPAAEELLGLKEDQLLGKTAFDPAWRFFREDGTVMPFEEYPVNQVLAKRQALRNFILGVHRPGKEKDDHVWALVNADPVIGEDDHITQVIVTFIDITERKRVERALEESDAKTRSILDNIGIGVALISPEMKILELNHRMREWFPGIDPGQHPVCYRAFNDPPREAMCDYCPTCKTLQDGLVHEATTKTPQAGGLRNYRIISSPILNVAGEVTAAIEMVDDITEKLSLESQLLQAQKLESVGRLAGGVAHDFNNMLGVILGFTELAMDKVDPALPLFAALQEIRKAAERSADLTHQLLAFARKQTISPRVLNLNETVGGMLSMLRRLIGEDIDLAWLPDKNLWPVKVDPSQIDQILANLCVNARDAIADVGKVTIEMGNVTIDEAYCTDHPGFFPGDFVMLAVSDDGHGMDKDTLNKVFEPFFTTKEIGRGTGLGLATVYGTVKQNSGFINVYSEPGHGTSFKIYLPRYAVKSEQTPKESPAAPVVRGHETILLVEDEPAILNMTGQMLETFGYRVLSALMPGEAIRLAREHAGEIHLLLSDVVMPEMNGRDLAKNLISLYPGIRCLFMSGYTANVIAHHGMLDDGINFIQKPFSIQALATKVREALDSGQ